jgi:two-component system chemotaxis response regulator CheY
MPGKRVLSVGQCYADQSAIARTLQKHFQAEVEAAATADEALTAARQQPFDLVLVNRVLDADGSSGLDVVAQIKSDEQLKQLPIMLVSNYEEAQREAVGQGALPGFGKAALGQPHMLARLEAFLR